MSTQETFLKSGLRSFNCDFNKVPIYKKNNFAFLVQIAKKSRCWEFPSTSLSLRRSYWKQSDIAAQHYISLKLSPTRLSNQITTDPQHPSITIKSSSSFPSVIKFRRSQTGLKHIIKLFPKRASSELSIAKG